MEAPSITYLREGGGRREKTVEGVRRRWKAVEEGERRRERIRTAHRAIAVSVEGTEHVLLLQSYSYRAIAVAMHAS